MSTQNISAARNLELSLEWGCDAEVWHIISPEQMQKLVESGDKDSFDDNEVCGEVDLECWLDDYELDIDQAEYDLQNELISCCSYASYYKESEESLELLLFMAVTDCPDHIMKQYM